MRQTIAGVIAGAAFAATPMATAAPAQACAVTDPCGSYGYYAYNYGCGYGTCGVRERLTDPDAYQTYASPQYYWVNQGPTYTGPGNFAPVPTYQERAVVGSRYYGRPYRYGYDGGPYGNATSHYYDGATGRAGTCGLQLSLRAPPLSPRLSPDALSSVSYRAEVLLHAASPWPRHGSRLALRKAASLQVLI